MQPPIRIHDDPSTICWYCTLVRGGAQRLRACTPLLITIALPFVLLTYHVLQVCPICSYLSFCWKYLYVLVNRFLVDRGIFTPLVLPRL